MSPVSKAQAHRRYLKKIVNESDPTSNPQKDSYCFPVCKIKEIPSVLKKNTFSRIKKKNRGQQVAQLIEVFVGQAWGT